LKKCFGVKRGRKWTSCYRPRSGGRAVSLLRFFCRRHLSLQRRQARWNTVSAICNSISTPRSPSPPPCARKGAVAPTSPTTMAGAARPTARDGTSITMTATSTPKGRHLLRTGKDHLGTERPVGELRLLYLRQGLL